MRELKLAQNFAIVALNAQDSLHMTTNKKIALRCMAASVILERFVEGVSFPIAAEPRKEKATNGDLISVTQNLYQEILLESFYKRGNPYQGGVAEWIRKAASLSIRSYMKFEKAMVDSLKAAEAIEEIPGLLGCDLTYHSAVVRIREFRSDAKQYDRVVEGMRADILEEGVVSKEAICMLWLLRESGCLQDIFSKNEVKTVISKMLDLYRSDSLAKMLFPMEIHKGIEFAAKAFFKAKTAMIKTPTGTGINFIIPILERSQSVFIETEKWFSKKEERLADVKARLDEQGHKYTVVHEGAVPLIKIDNMLYEAIPEAVAYRIPIQGVRLRRYPM